LRRLVRARGAALPVIKSTSRERGPAAKAEPGPSKLKKAIAASSVWRGRQQGRKLRRPAGPSWSRCAGPFSATESDGEDLAELTGVPTYTVNGVTAVTVHSDSPVLRSAAGPSPHDVAGADVASSRPPWRTSAVPSARIMNSLPTAPSCISTVPAAMGICMSSHGSAPARNGMPPRRVRPRAVPLRRRSFSACHRDLLRRAIDCPSHPQLRWRIPSSNRFPSSVKGGPAACCSRPVVWVYLRHEGQLLELRTILAERRRRASCRRALVAAGAPSGACGCGPAGTRVITTSRTTSGHGVLRCHSGEFGWSRRHRGSQGRSLRPLECEESTLLLRAKSLGPLR